MLIARIIRVGRGAGFAFLLLGMVLTFVHHPEYRDVAGGIDTIVLSREHPSSLRDALSHILAFHGRGFTALGIIILIATPTARLVWRAIDKLLSRDRGAGPYLLAALALLVIWGFLFVR